MKIDVETLGDLVDKLSDVERRLPMEIVLIESGEKQSTMMAVLKIESIEILRTRKPGVQRLIVNLVRR